MKRFTVPCDLPDRRGSFHVYVGRPAPGAHPLQYQVAWLREIHEGTVDPEVLLAFGRLLEVAREGEVAFEELCAEAFDHSF